MTIKTPTLFAAMLALGTTAAMAQDDTTLDANGDGFVTLDEVQTVLPDMTEETFITLDANGDGALDADELAMARDSGALGEAESDS